jgi:hypothetical protein
VEVGEVRAEGSESAETIQEMPRGISPFPPVKGGKSPLVFTGSDASVPVVQTRKIDGSARSLRCPSEIPELNMGAISAVRST